MKMTIEQRLQRIKDIYFSIESILDSLPETVPDDIKKTIRTYLLNDKEIKRIMQGLEEARPPRFLMVGRTGVGKSSLINAIVGKYVANVSDVHIGTKDIERHAIFDGDKKILEVLDSRGIGESIKIDDSSRTAEDILVENMLEFKPDAILFILRCKSRDRILDDIDYIKRLKREYYYKKNVEIPIIVILNQADEMEPSEFKEQYPHRKLENIRESESQIRRILQENDVSYATILSVSSYIDWGYSSDELSKMSPKERELLKIQKDYRYNIDNLVSELANNLEVDAMMGLMMLGEANQVLSRICQQFIKIFASIAGLIAATPLPLADIIPLTAIQACMVNLIRYISGESLSINATKGFLRDLMGLGIGGNIFKLTAKQLAKLIPGPGNLVNSATAIAGTKLIGNLAIQHYIYGVNIKELKKKMKNKANIKCE